MTPPRREKGVTSTGVDCLSFVTDALAVRRLTRLLIEDTLLEIPRQRLTEKFWSDAPHAPVKILSCPHCASVHAAFAVTLTHTPLFRFLRPVIYALAISDVSSLYYEFIARNDNQAPGNWGA